MSKANQKAWKEIGDEFTALAAHVRRFKDGAGTDRDESAAELDSFRDELHEFMAGIESGTAFDESGHSVSAHRLFQEDFFYVFFLLDSSRTYPFFPFGAEEIPDNSLGILSIALDSTFGGDYIGASPIDQKKLKRLIDFFEDLCSLANLFSLRGRRPDIKKLNFR